MYLARDVKHLFVKTVVEVCWLPGANFPKLRNVLDNLIKGDYDSLDNESLGIVIKQMFQQKPTEARSAFAKALLATGHLSKQNRDYILEMQ